MRRLLLLCGGKSAEHEISIKTTKNILNAIDRTKFTPILVGISRSGTWYYFDDESMLAEIDKIEDIYPIDLISGLLKFPAYACLSTQQGLTIPIDIALPTLHGPNGEDGTVQGFFELCGIPYVGCGVLASAAAMDKNVFKEILFSHGITVTPSIALTQQDPKPSYNQLINALGGEMFFVKPSSMGSSIGISKVVNANDLEPAIDKAFEYSQKILIEKGIDCREIECAVLGNIDPKASILGEICPTHDFYSYKAKYFDENGARLVIPALLSEKTTLKIQELAIKAFKAINGRGLARVDFFLSPEGEIYVNEINTFPGFTNVSMYPKLWQESGISYSELISKLIELAYEEFELKSNLNIYY